MVSVISDYGLEFKMILKLQTGDLKRLCAACIMEVGLLACSSTKETNEKKIREIYIAYVNPLL